MCGFAGALDTSGLKGRDALCDAVQAMTAVIQRRGPDDAGVWIDDATGTALGFRRLAILELSDAGHQPFVSLDGQFVLVFNGEIYNHAELRSKLAVAGSDHAWTGHSDTETLLACCQAWGIKKALEEAVGMFALALWDRGARRLHLARDRFGEKPLYYGWTRHAFVFGSELGALRAYPGFENPIDADVLSLYMQYACVPAPYAIYRHIFKLEPGCVLSLSLQDAGAPPAHALIAPARHGSATLERYWSLVDVAAEGMANPILDEGDASRQMEAVLTEAVQLQSIADVPLGAFLSGGIDSSVIVALMQAQSTRRIKTFTIGFDEAGFNEAIHARAVAQHLGTDHAELYVSPQQARDVIPSLPSLYSEPFADSSQIPTHLVSRIARQHVTVALSGDGGDELFGGYTRYQWGPRVWKSVKWLSPSLRRTLGTWIETIPMATWDRLGSLAPGQPLARVGDKAHKLAYRLARMNNVDDLYRMLVTTWPADTAVVRSARPLPMRFEQAASKVLAVRSVEHRMMLLDALTYLPDDILHKVDRASMGISLETRAPFLDHRVAALAWRLPLHMKIRNGQGKWLLRQLLYRHVPQSLIERPKMGFGVPLGAWLRGPLREWAEHLLSESALASEGLLNPAPVRQKWQEHLSGHRSWQSELWTVLMFQAWREASK